MKIDFPAPGQEQDLFALWETAFGDPKEFIDSFFQTAYSPRRCRCIADDTGIRAMLYWFDCEYRGKPLAYLYAIATRPDSQGRGLCRRLMANTHSLLLDRGYAGTVLVPGEPGLFAMYEKLGYRYLPGIRAEESVAGANSLALWSVGPEEYGALRRRLMPEGGVIQEGENLAFLRQQADLYAGNGFLLCAQKIGNRLMIPEFLGNTAAIPGILNTLGGSRGFFRTPGGSRPFAMYFPLGETQTPDWFGLAFD